MANTEELRLDVEELQSLLSQASRQKVRDLLQVELRKLQTEITHRLEDQSNNAAQDAVASSSVTTTVPSTSKPKIPLVTIDSYAWDQSEKFMKIYATVNGVQTVEKENVECEFKKRGFKLKVKELNNKNHQLYINTLMEEIIPEESHFKIKTDTVLLMLKKKEQGKTWAYVTEREKKSKEEKKPKFDENKDPNDSLMQMMQQMYEEGDDEMKRTIAKSMYESRKKQGTL